ncbi:MULTISPECIES: TonB-dependent receptor [unclassified Helicobacter]|uniref:TonB-dependent receptor n=1 Tax=unclassified Helicobacter TaxID=2593540 RepID=UPI000AD21C93|nr:MULTISPECIES: TonB-dependent receptor [unclassified Helicobacter]
MKVKTFHQKPLIKTSFILAGILCLGAQNLYAKPQDDNAPSTNQSAQNSASQNDANSADSTSTSDAESSDTSAQDSNPKDSSSLESHTLEKVKVTAQAAMSDLPIELQSKQISVIDKDTLLETNIGGGGIQSVLEKVPGILYSRSGGVNGQITIRGQNSNNQRSVIMIDGVRYSGRNTLDFNMLDPYAFEGVEVIRGAASSLWGSDAMNGVINFRSRTSNYNLGSTSFKATAKIRALEYSSVNQGFRGRLELLGGGAGFDVLVGLSGSIAQNYTTPIQENGSYQAKNSNYNTIGVDFNAGYTHNTTRYYLQGRYGRVESHRAGGLGAAPGSSYGILMSENPITEYYLRAGLKKTELSFADYMEAYVYYRHWDTDIWNNRLDFNGANIHQLVYDNQYFGGRLIFGGQYGRHNLVYGAEIETGISPTQVRQNNLVSNASNTTNRASSATDIALFVKDDFRAFDSWYLNASLRGDYVVNTISKTRSSTENNLINANNQIAIESARLLDENGVIHQGAVTGSVGSVWFITDYISNVINISHNFKNAPVGTRMSSTPSGSSTLTTANPLIKPEYSQTAELGFRFQSDNHFAALTGFFTNYLDMLTLSSYQNATITAGNNLYRYENIGRALITGVELEGRHSFLDSMIVLSYSGAYNYGQNLSANKPIAYLAPLYGQVTLAFNFRHWYFSVTERGYGAKTRIDASEERKTNAYAMTDVYVGVKAGKLAPDMEFIFGISNLFNQIGRNPVTVENINRAIAITNPLVEPGRSFNAKLIWKY